MILSNLLQQLKKRAIWYYFLTKEEKWFYVKVGEEKTSLQNNFNTRIAFKGKKLNSCFKIKES